MLQLIGVDAKILFGCALIDMTLIECDKIAAPEDDLPINDTHEWHKIKKLISFSQPSKMGNQTLITEYRRRGFQCYTSQ